MTAATGKSTEAPASKKSGFRPDVQGLRAIAVLLVVLYHAGVSRLSGGYVGVDVFFVISGFLITTHLLEMLQTHGRIRFGSFYAKRARRILPASLLVGLLTVVAAWIWMPPLLMNEVARGAVAAALYVPNMLFVSQETNYLAETSPSVFQHYWSLGIEEQFYLFWPAILALGFWLGRRSEKRLLIMAAVLTVGSFALCVAWMGVSQPWTFFSLPTRAWELGAGALVAFLMRTGAPWLRRAGIGLLSWVGLGLLLGVGLLYQEETPFPGYTAALPVIATALLIIGGAAPGALNANRLLSLRPFQFVGAISYSLYLVHWPLLVIPQVAVGEENPLPLWSTLALGALAVPVAWLLFRFVERPVIAWSPLRTRSQLWTGVSALAASAVLIAAGSGAHLATEQEDTTTDKTASAEEVTEEPEGTDFVPANLTPTLEDADDDNPAIYDNDCHRDKEGTDSSGCQIGDNEDAPLVFLFGDSHAASWYPALEELAKDGKIRLDTNTKNSCYSANVQEELEGVPYTDCDQWRQGVIDRINEEQPELVLMANYGAERIDRLGGTDDFGADWQQSMESTISAIDGPQVDVIADVPHQDVTPAVCLSKDLESADECAIPRAEAFDPAVVEAEKAATEDTDARYLDFSDYLCNEEECPMIIGNILVYRDGHHLTAHYSRELTEPLWEELSSALD